MTDKVSNIAPVITQTLNVTVDTTAPTATITPAAGMDDAFTLTFNKDMNPTSVTGASITVADETLSGSTFGTPTITQPDTTNAKVYLVTGSNASTMFANKTSRTFTVALPATITDSLGNAFVTTTQSVTLTKDTTKPTITGVNVVKDASGNVTSIVLTSSSTLSAASLAGLTIVDGNGVLCTGTTALGTLTASTTAGTNKVTITPQNQVPLTGKYTFTFAAGTLSDQSATANTSDAYTTVVDFGTSSSSTGTFTQAGTISASSNVITVPFGTAVKGGSDVAESATNLANYTLNGAALPAGTTITLDTVSGPTTATITLPAGSIATSDTNAVFTINNVQDSTGNTIVPVTTTVPVVDNIAPVLQSAKVLDNQDIILTYNEAMKTYGSATNAGTDFTVTNGTSTWTLAASDVNVTNVPGYSKELKLNIAATPATSGTAEVNTLTVANAATASGNITVTFNDGTINEPVTVAVASGDTAAQVAAKIQAAMAADTTINAAYNVTNAASSADVVFTAKAAAANKTVTVTTVDTGSTGVGTPASTQTTAGVAPIAATGHTLDLTKAITITANSGSTVVEDAANNNQAVSSTITVTQN